MATQPDPEPKPSLHEIAAMPFPASQTAMRKHYNPDWHKDIPEGKKVFRVSVDWSLEGSFVEDIEAEDEEEAREIAEEMASDEASDRMDIEVSFRSVKALHS